MALSPQQDDHILTVGELAAQLKQVLNEQFPGLWVRGEITGFKRYDSGHLYFTLKDGTPAMVSAVMWRGNAGKLAFTPKDGTEVEAFGDVDFYGGNGRCQFVVRQMRPAGIGALQLQFEELKARLQAEGLFDASRKQPLPRFPKRIGIVTSKMLREKRRYFIVVAFIIAAVLTPPDVLSQASLAIPLLVLYEGAIFSVAMVEKKAAASTSASAGATSTANPAE